MRRSKYPSLGILDALFKLVYGFHLDPSKNGLFESLPPESRLTRNEYSKVLYKLELNGYITKKSSSILFTEKGEEKALLRSMGRIEPPKKRDGYSRLIAFDIPEKMRSARDAMRQKLYDFECIKIQKSLYLSQYVCEREIEEVARILKLKNHIQVFVIRSRCHFTVSHDRRKKVK